MNLESSAPGFLKAEEFAELPAESMAFVFAYTFVDLGRAYSQIAGLMNSIVLGQSREKNLRIQVDKKGFKPEEVFIEFDGDMDFRLEANQSRLGVQFLKPVRVPEAIDITKQFVDKTLELFQKLEVLPVENAEAIVLDIRHNFRMADPYRKNKHVVNERLVPGLVAKDGLFSDLVTSFDDLGRVDLKFMCELEGRDQYISIECPGNDDYSTVWPTYNCRTGDEFPLAVSDLRASVAQFIDRSYKSFGPVRSFLERLLAGERVHITQE